VPHLSPSSIYVERDGKMEPIYFKDGSENLSRYAVNIHKVYTISSSNGMLIIFFKFAKILFILLGIYFLRKILSNTKQDHPFVFNNVQSLRRISYLIFTYVILDWCYKNLFMPYMSQQIIPGNFHSINRGKKTKMAIIVNVDVMLAKRKMSLTELSNRVGITMANLSILKKGRGKAIRFSTLEAICEALECQPGDLLEFQPNEDKED